MFRIEVKVNIAVQYADKTGNIRAGYPYNQNGSVRNIADNYDDSGRIFGLMPHF